VVSSRAARLSAAGLAAAALRVAGKELVVAVDGSVRSPQFSGKTFQGLVVSCDESSGQNSSRNGTRKVIRTAQTAVIKTANSGHKNSKQRS
jgi:hypothetical protein